MNRGNMNDGTRDIGNSQAAVLLFRGLDPLSGPQAIHQAMKSSSGVGKEGAQGMKRIILIKDKVTMASFGFAFVEFVDVQVYHSALHCRRHHHLPPTSLHQLSWQLPCRLSCIHQASGYQIGQSLRRSPILIHSNLSLT